LKIPTRTEEFKTQERQQMAEEIPMLTSTTNVSG